MLCSIVWATLFLCPVGVQYLYTRCNLPEWKKMQLPEERVQIHSWKSFRDTRKTSQVPWSKCSLSPFQREPYLILQHSLHSMDLFPRYRQNIISYPKICKIWQRRSFLVIAKTWRTIIATVSRNTMRSDIPEQCPSPTYTFAYPMMCVCTIHLGVQ